MLLTIVAFPHITFQHIQSGTMPCNIFVLNFAIGGLVIIKKVKSLYLTMCVCSQYISSWPVSSSLQVQVWQSCPDIAVLGIIPCNNNNHLIQSNTNSIIQQIPNTTIWITWVTDIRDIRNVCFLQLSFTSFLLFTDSFSKSVTTADCFWISSEKISSWHTLLFITIFSPSSKVLQCSWCTCVSSWLGSKHTGHVRSA